MWRSKAAMAGWRATGSSSNRGSRFCRIAKTPMCVFQNQPVVQIVEEVFAAYPGQGMLAPELLEVTTAFAGMRRDFSNEWMTKEALAQWSITKTLAALQRSTFRSRQMTTCNSERGPAHNQSENPT
jgi:hypothetical protein